MKIKLDKQERIPYIKSMNNKEREIKEYKMVTLTLDFDFSEKELEELRQYTHREFNCCLEDKLIFVVSDWLGKARETIAEEAKVIEEIEKEYIEAMMKAKRDAGIKIHEGRYPGLKEISKKEYGAF